MGFLLANWLLILPLIVTALLFPVPAFVCLRVLPASLRWPAFTLVNILGCAGLLLLAAIRGVRFQQLGSFIPIVAFFTAVYVGLVLLDYVLLRRATESGLFRPWMAFWFPIAMLAWIKYTPPAVNPFRALLGPFGHKQLGDFFLGLSYMAFRLSHMAQEVRNGVAKQPNAWQHLSFAFFVPTFSIGPISRYSTFEQSIANPDRTRTPVSRALLRIAVGLAKYLFLSSLLNQFTYAGLLLNGHPHSVFDLVTAGIAFTLYLYCNFSGFCDIVIGVAGLIGIEVLENFDNPFLARDLQEFWNRWHITLSHYLRDMMFTPLSKWLARRVSPRNRGHAIALSIFLVFVVVGIWHGAGWNFVVFGVFQGLGLVVCQYYTEFLKKRLGKQRYAAYLKKPFIHGAALILTFLYTSFTLFFLANSWANMARIARVVH
jgi:D-alanyl-lipoteichoic acid acyltransferase DltB (MBOAT superfamily)